jgi:hypothetical protein
VVAPVQGAVAEQVVRGAVLGIDVEEHLDGLLRLFGVAHAEVHLSQHGKGVGGARVHLGKGPCGGRHRLHGAAPARPNGVDRVTFAGRYGRAPGVGLSDVGCAGGVRPTGNPSYGKGEGELGVGGSRLVDGLTGGDKLDVVEVVEARPEVHLGGRRGGEGHPLLCQGGPRHQETRDD